MKGPEDTESLVLVAGNGRAVGSIVEKPVRGKNDEPAQVNYRLLWSSAMSVTLTVDHRAVDGLTAAKFLSDLRSLFQALLPKFLHF